MPVIDLETPTLCVVGALNVGKSSLVLVLSTGKPEQVPCPSGRYKSYSDLH
nr:nucleolar GTP-binding protein 1 [Ipomoea batatas]